MKHIKPIIPCERCGYLASGAQGCALLKIKVDPAADFCSHFVEAKDIIYCVQCGRPITPHLSIICGEDIYCKDCFNTFGTCIHCKNRDDCKFDTDPSPLPKTIRQKTMYTVTDIPNPERVRITCQNGCECFSEEFGCLKQKYQTCEKYEEVM